MFLHFAAVHFLALLLRLYAFEVGIQGNLCGEPGGMQTRNTYAQNHTRQSGDTLRPAAYHNLVGIESKYGHRVEEDKFNFRFGPSLSRTLSKSSLRPNVNNNYWTYGGRANFWVKLPGKLELQSDVQANLQQKTEAFPNPVNITVWNARLTRKFLKDNALEAGIIANDILNQNIGFNRTINSSFVKEERYDRVAQYFQIMLLWNFNKMPGGK